MSYSIRLRRKLCDAERCWVLQSAVAFWSVLFCFAFVGCRPAESKVTKFQAATSSMAPTWFGQHLTAACTQCGQSSPIVHEAFDANIPTRCMSCGAVCICNSELSAGEVVEVEKHRESVPIQRFDVVTFEELKTEEDKNSPTLKRVWAFPGESIELRGGEAWINGTLFQKTAKEMVNVCVPLSRFPKDSRSHWWLVSDSSKVPTTIEDSAVQTHISLKPNQRLEFHYTRPNRNPELPEMLPSPIVNDYPFNQNSVAQLHQVPDYMLAIEFVEPARGSLFVTLRYLGVTYKVRLGSDARDNENSTEIRGASRILLAICDERLLVSTEKRDQQWPIDELDRATENELDNEQALITLTTIEPLGIKRLLVARDQWLGPREMRSTDWQPSGTDAEIATEIASGFFVLGDNLELSVDSRDVGVGRIAPSRITGRVKRIDETSDWILSLLNASFRDLR